MALPSLYLYHPVGFGGEEQTKQMEKKKKLITTERKIVKEELPYQWIVPNALTAIKRTRDGGRINGTTFKMCGRYWFMHFTPSIGQFGLYMVQGKPYKTILYVSAGETARKTSYAYEFTEMTDDNAKVMYLTLFKSEEEMLRAIQPNSSWLFEVQMDPLYKV